MSNTTAQQSIEISGEVMVYLSMGEAMINGEVIKARSLIHNQQGVSFTALTAGQAIFIYQTDQHNEVLS